MTVGQAKEAIKKIRGASFDSEEVACEFLGALMNKKKNHQTAVT